MRIPWPRVTLRAWLVGLAFVALGLCGVRAVMPVFWYFGLGDGTYQGPNTDLLNSGRTVVVTADFRAAPASRVLKPTGRTDSKSAMYGWPIVTPEGELRVTGRTRGVVVIDPAWDDDSCYPDRPIAVEITEGAYRGKVVAFPRYLLRGT
jgi:hypothetical protein